MDTNYNTIRPVSPMAPYDKQSSRSSFMRRDFTITGPLLSHDSVDSWVAWMVSKTTFQQSSWANPPTHICSQQSLQLQPFIVHAHTVLKQGSKVESGSLVSFQKHKNTICRESLLTINVSRYLPSSAPKIYRVYVYMKLMVASLLAMPLALVTQIHYTHVHVQGYTMYIVHVHVYTCSSPLRLQSVITMRLNGDDGRRVH